MTRLNCAALLLLSCLLAACGQAPTPAPAKPTGPAVDSIATVNGKPVSRAEYNLYISNIERQANGVKLEPAERDAARERFIGLHLAADAAIKRGLDKEPKVADELSFARTKVLSDAALQRYLDENPVQESELKPAYEAGVANLPPQYHTCQILLDDPALAAELITKLQAGASFAKLARQHSKDSSKKSGGDIGWLSPLDMGPEYAAAVAKLEPGQITPQPVKSIAGWHVIRLEAKRRQDVEKFEAVKDKVVLLLKRERINKYLETLRKEAKIEMEQRGPQI